jgi:hypothetical protein
MVPLEGLAGSVPGSLVAGFFRPDDRHSNYYAIVVSSCRIYARKDASYGQMEKEEFVTAIYRWSERGAEPRAR